MRILKDTLRYYLIIVFILALTVFSACGILLTQEKGRYAVFGEEPETIQLSAEEIGTELKKILKF